MKFKLPIPFFYIQSDIEIITRKKFNELELLLVSAIYSYQIGELENNELLKDAIKKIYNIDGKFLPFLQNTLQNLINNKTILFKKNILSENHFNETLKNFVLNKKIFKTFNNTDNFTGLDTENLNVKLFVYNNLTNKNINFEIREKPLNELDINFNNYKPNIREIFLNFQNIIDAKIKKYILKKILQLPKFQN